METKITVTHLMGTNREIADYARTTIGLGGGDKQVSDSYMRKLYLCEHSPIRNQWYKIRFENIPYWVTMHLCRHKVGVEHFVSTQRTDRTGKSTRGEQDAPVLYEMTLNAQAIITISRKRLCNCAAKETKQIWKSVVSELSKINPALASCCVPDCVYRSWCMEHKTCNFHKTDKFKEDLMLYRKGINE